MLVDADVHLDVPVRDLAPFVEPPWRAHLELSPPGAWFPNTIGDQTVGGRIVRPLADGHGMPLKADISVAFPTRLLALGLQPNALFEAAVAAGYARWLTEAFLPAHPHVRGMLYLPLADPDACCAIVGAYGERPGVVGACAVNARFRQLHANRYVPLYHALEDRELALAFHPISAWSERPFSVFDRYLPVWALGHPFSQVAQLTNWVLHAMPDRFPRLHCVFYEAGLSWLTFVAHRLDQEFMKRPSEAPLLRERPSHYVRRCFFSTQPVDQFADPASLEAPVRLVGCDRLVYASNYPQWDFDLPLVIERLPFLTDVERRLILGANAERLFHLNRSGAGEAA